MGDGLVLHTMHYPDEVLSLDDALPGSLANSKPGTKEVQVVRQLIDALSKPLDLASFKDEYHDRIEDLVERKRQGKKTVDVADDHDDEPMPRTVDLMDGRGAFASHRPSTATVLRHPRRKSA